MAVINYSFSIVVAGGPRVNHAARLEPEAYDLLEVEVPGKDPTSTTPGEATVEVLPSGSDVELLLITAASYAGLQYSVTNGVTDAGLDAPLLLIGGGAVSLLGTTAPTEFVFKNSVEGVTNTVNILIGRDAVVPTP
jgi:hypothetical protein